jgi:hypothetical protein
MMGMCKHFVIWTCFVNFFRCFVASTVLEAYVKPHFPTLFYLNTKK